MYSLYITETFHLCGFYQNRYSCEICNFSGKLDGLVYFLKGVQVFTGKLPVCKQTEANDIKLHLFNSICKTD